MARWLVRAERLPIRVRLTIAFAAVMAAVLAAAGVFLYSQFAADLDAQLDAALRAEATDLAALVEQGGAGAVTVSGEPLAQVFGARRTAGRVHAPGRPRTPPHAGRGAPRDPSPAHDPAA